MKECHILVGQNILWRLPYIFTVVKTKTPNPLGDLRPYCVKHVSTKLRLNTAAVKVYFSMTWRTETCFGGPWHTEFCENGRVSANKQTNRLTNAVENITSLVEVMKAYNYVFMLNFGHVLLFFWLVRLRFRSTRRRSTSVEKPDSARNSAVIEATPPSADKITPPIFELAASPSPTSLSPGLLVRFYKYLNI